MAEIRLSVRISCLQQPFKQALLTAARLGAAGVEIDARTEVRPADLSDTALRQLRKMLDDLNLRVSSVRFQTSRGYDVQADLDRRIDATKAAMRMAYQVGAGVVVNQIGRIPAEATSPNWQTFRDVMEDLGRFGAHTGAVLAAETGTESGEDLMRLLTQGASGFVGVALNPANWILNDIPIESNIHAVAERVQLVIAQDAVRDLAARRGVDVPLGQGTADLPNIIGILEDRQYRGWYVVAHQGSDNPEVSVQRAINYLRNL